MFRLTLSMRAASVGAVCAGGAHDKLSIVGNGGSVSGIFYLPCIGRNWSNGDRSTVPGTGF
ncbi:hypothetical protein XH93_28020 [Bradyrhizobium sp. CCBAU 51753]|nr:hypothetical protein XH93_28020 [Bradyrhizobium sp. CCBAU 51753]